MHFDKAKHIPLAFFDRHRMHFHNSDHPSNAHEYIVAAPCHHLVGRYDKV